MRGNGVKTGRCREDMGCILRTCCPNHLREGERPREPWWSKNDEQNKARQEPRPPLNIAAAI